MTKEVGVAAQGVGAGLGATTAALVVSAVEKDAGRVDGNEEAERKGQVT